MVSAFAGCGLASTLVHTYGTNHGPFYGNQSGQHLVNIEDSAAAASSPLPPKRHGSLAIDGVVEMVSRTGARVVTMGTPPRSAAAPRLHRALAEALHRHPRGGIDVWSTRSSGDASGSGWRRPGRYGGGGSGHGRRCRTVRWDLRTSGSAAS